MPICMIRQRYYCGIAKALFVSILLLMVASAWGEENFKWIWHCGDAFDFEQLEEYQCKPPNNSHQWENNIPTEEKKELSKIYLHIPVEEYINRFWKCKECGLLRVDWVGWTFFRSNRKYQWSGACQMFHSGLCPICSDINVLFI